MNRTANQQRAIEARGNVLVMAGAGTGKTRTLVERCVAWLLSDQEQGSLDQVLMVTFTEAAAAEMRQRIRETLQAQLQALPGHARLAEQLALLDTAHVRTLHSFCYEMVRQHFHELALDPQVMVLEQAQATLLAHEVLDELFKAHYAGAGPVSEAVQALIVERGRGWHVPIRALVLRLHTYRQSLRDPAAWLAQQFRFFGETEPTTWRQWLKESFLEQTPHWLAALDELKGHAHAAECRAALACLGRNSALADIYTAAQTIAACALALKGKKKVDPALKNFFEAVAAFRPFMPAPGQPEPLAQDWEWTRPQMLALLHLADEFAQKFSEAKRAQAAVDFSDLEQLALDLLWDRRRLQPKPAALAWRQTFRLVFVDEYQDINEAQDTILQALAREGAEANRFLVGDVKQSIYRFRLANPRIFQDYAHQWQKPRGGGQVIPLAENFRSHESILNFVNPLFTALLCEELGGVVYDADAWLKFGAPKERAALQTAADPAEERRVELLLRLKGDPSDQTDPTDQTDDSDGNALDEVEAEARLVGMRLLELKQSGCLIWDDKEKRHRPAGWRDMVVLLRSPSSKLDGYAKEFSKLDIPLITARGGFFDCLEISDLLNLLRLLDNPLQDIPLLAVLRSPLAGLSLEELAEIRAALPKGRLWLALCQWCNAHAQADEASAPPALWSKLGIFTARFKRWRTMVRMGSLSECLEAILDETHYPEWCQAQDRGRQRYANVQRLVALTHQFDPLQRQGLSRFLKYVEALGEAGVETEPARVDAEDAVRLMSIHQSKGLEFPVVVAADLGKPFNFRDGAAEIIFDEQFGLCPKVKPPHTGQRYASLPHQLARLRQRRETLGEELRLLYVALTRASSRLILTGSVSERRAENWSALADVKDAEQRVLKGGSMLDWVAGWLATMAEAEAWWTKENGSCPLLQWRVITKLAPVLEREVPAAAQPSVKPPAPAAPPPALHDVLQRISWNYAFTGAIAEPAKTTVTRLRQRAAQEEDYAQPLGAWQRPTFTGIPRAGKLSAADRGTAHHLFLQYMSLDMASSEAELRANAQQLLQRRALTPEQYQALDFTALAQFWLSPTGLRIRIRKAQTHREIPFTARIDAADLAAVGLAAPAAALADEFVTLQGVADLAVIAPKEIWLLDFKTDRFKPQMLAQRVAEYTPQLRAYALALGRIYQRPVTQMWLHFLELGETVAVGQKSPPPAKQPTRTPDLF